uniref:Secreted protein n=1 Tax=Pipistrellus kuhlii TaxID=59472 RepID=A0A7J7SMW4_PIPKU|nr:hypothetical protein mPipKuh1_009800 [Pipistrellus kuhlii]
MTMQGCRALIRRALLFLAAARTVIAPTNEAGLREPRLLLGGGRARGWAGTSARVSQQTPPMRLQRRRGGRCSGVSQHRARLTDRHLPEQRHVPPLPIGRFPQHSSPAGRLGERPIRQEELGPAFPYQ